jgi:hypothetical protein
MVSSVLLPEPLAPMTATITPASTVRLIALSACTSATPCPYTLLTECSSSTLIAAPPPAAAPWAWEIRARVRVRSPPA